MDYLQRAASEMRATPADIPGLWNVPGYPELTTGQLLQEFGSRMNKFAELPGGWLSTIQAIRAATKGD